MEGTPNAVLRRQEGRPLRHWRQWTNQVCGSHLGAVDHEITSSDGKYNDPTATVPVTNNAKDFGTGPRVIDVLIRDDDQPGVRLGVRSLNALEGQPASYRHAPAEPAQRGRDR